MWPSLVKIRDTELKFFISIKTIPPLDSLNMRLFQLQEPVFIIQDYNKDPDRPVLSDATSEAALAYPCAAPYATPVLWLLCVAKLTRNFILGILVAWSRTYFSIILILVNCCIRIICDIVGTVCSLK